MIKKVLIIRFRRIGDAVLSTVLCSTIRKNFPEAEVHYLLHDPINTLFEYHPDIDKVISFPAKDSVGSYLKRVWRLMRKEKYDAIIDTVPLLLLCVSPGFLLKQNTVSGLGRVILSSVIITGSPIKKTIL